VIAIIFTVLLKLSGSDRGIDETSASDYDNGNQGSELQAKRLIKEYPSSQVSK
jgi:hypothetical protein